MQLEEAERKYITVGLFKRQNVRMLPFKKGRYIYIYHVLIFQIKH